MSAGPNLLASTIDGAAVGVPLVVAAGAGGAVLLERWNMRGTVAIAPAVAMGLLVPLLNAAIWPFAAAVVCGVLRERWRIAEIEKGQDKARRARQAVGLKALARNAQDRRRLARGTYGDGNRYAIGTDEAEAVVSLPLGLAEGSHGLVIGATGSGKTTTLLAMAQAHIDAGCGVIAIDPKASRSLTSQLERAAARAGREFESFSLTEPSGGRWNPIARGTPTELTDKLIAAEEWTEPHYKRLYQRYLLTVFTAITARGDVAHIGMVVDLLRPERLTRYARDITDPEIADRVDRHLAELTDREVRDLAGLSNRLALLSESELGPLLKPTGDGDPDTQIDLLATVKARGVTVFSLDSASYPETVKLLGAALFQDLKSIAGKLENDDAPAATVIVDEFSSFGQDHVVGLFQRARSARLSLLLATQELADLRKVDASLQDQVLGNVETVIAHRQNVPDSAELLAQLAGTRDTWIHTFQSDRDSAWRGIRATRGTKHRGHEFHVAPDTIKQLDIGQAVVVSKNPHAVHRVRVLSPTQRRPKPANTKGPR